MVSALISRVILLVFGTLYPAYRSYKAIKNKDVREYVKWMMYWIIFALFTSFEAFADFFISWLPLYYEIKIVFIIWLLSPATKGSSILYRKFVHPRLQKHEKAIDKYISQAQKNSYATIMDVGRKGLNVATDTFIKTAVSGQYQLAETLKRYNSMQELRNPANDVTDAGIDDDRRVTWYEGMAVSRNGNPYDPENDVDILQNQYKTNRPENLIREEFEMNEMQRSQSDIEISSVLHHDDSNRFDRTQSDPTSMSPDKLVASAPILEENDKAINYNYQYSSNTLPRVRKPKKPIYETMPANRTTRTRKTVDKTKNK